MSEGQGANADEGAADLGLPWLVDLLRQALATQQGHAILVRGPGGVGEFELALALAQGWLCEATDRPITERPCRHCASCKLFAAHSHPDLLVLVPEVLRESLGWELGGESEEGGAGEASGKRKPSKEIRVEAIRAVIEFATTTSARGRGKAVIVHPAERMNDVAASAFLKTLEEPAGAARFVLCSASPDQLLPTIRSRCQQIVVPIPPRDAAIAWLRQHGIERPEVLLAASGGRPQEALRLAERGIDAAAWLALPARIAAGDAAALHGWPLPAAVDALQKLCHDALSLACAAEPHYFVGARLRGDAAISALLRWWRELARVAEEVEHPWSVDLTVESLVGQGREALKTPRSRGSRGDALSLNSAR
jgi:DNA polymerase III subunit delta'